MKISFTLTVNMEVVIIMGGSASSFFSSGDKLGSVWSVKCCFPQQGQVPGRVEVDIFKEGYEE